MLIRIGDEKRDQRDEHLTKLKGLFTSYFVLKHKGNKDALIESLLTCIVLMPHKVGLYSYLVAATCVESFEFGQEIVFKVVETLNETLIRDGDCFKSKNIMRLLGFLVQVGLITTEAFCSLLLQMVEDYMKLAGAGKGTGAQTHSSDLILETILSSLPNTFHKLQKEQSIDFGTVIESLKQIFKARSSVVAKSEAQTDLLEKTWEALF